MTQPLPPQAEDDRSHVAVIATAAAGLALIALESRVRSEVEDDITAAFAPFAATLVAVAGLTVFITGTALLSQPRVHDSLTKSVSQAKAATLKRIKAGYAAGQQVAIAQASRDLGDDMPDDFPELDASVDQINRDIEVMFGDVQMALQDGIRDAYDGISGPGAQDARTIAIRQAAENAVAGVQNRADAAATTAVHQAARDAQQAIYSQYRNDTGHLVSKRWVATSANPCGMCAALDGTICAITDEFDHDATHVEADLRPVWRNLLGPPRHPNCRCQLELVAP